MCTCTCRLVLFIVNIVVGLAGFLLLVLGALLTWGRAVVEEQINSLMKQAIITFYGQKTAAEVTKVADLVLRITTPFGLIIFCFGVIIFLICAFGCFGACCNSALCLKIYLGFHILVAVLEIIALVFYYSQRDLVFSLAQRLLYSSLLKYQSIESKDSNSLLFNAMMPSLQCCGLFSASDFEKAKDFNRQFNNSTDVIDLAYPVTCCKMDSSYNILDNSCPGEFNSQNSNIEQGCWQQLYPHMVYYGNAISIIGLIVLMCQISLIVLSIMTLAWKQI